MLKLWDPFYFEKTNSSNSARKHIDALNSNLENTFSNLFSCGIHWNKTDSGELSAFIDVPGIDQKDLNIELLNGRVTIKGKRETNNYSSSICKSFDIPDGYHQDDCKAELKNGVLTISLIKLEHKNEAKKIEIT